MRTNKVIYKLMIEDVQSVAEQEIERKLTAQEINFLIDDIADRIPWYDAISESIAHKIKK